MKQLLFLIIFLATLFTCSSQFFDEFDLKFEALKSGPCTEEGMIPCLHDGCFHQSQLCDGKIDCDDATDENNCHDHKADVKMCNQTHQFLCSDGDACIPKTMLCNNISDCSDGSDEVNCTHLLHSNKTSSCKGFQCDDGKCISKLWMCDGIYDCDDKSDEYNRDLCKTVEFSYTILDGNFCLEFMALGYRSYKCLDASYCLPSNMMCDGIQDCRDGSDEGLFCKSWNTMCVNFTCSGNGTYCSPERHGPVCKCGNHMRQYNYLTKQCDDIDDCITEIPQCSHSCHNGDGHFTCSCDDGYVRDDIGYLCYAKGPEAMLFFSTNNDIRYLKIKSKQMVIIATGTKQAHGVSFDGTYVYWVETAAGHQSIYKAQLDDVKDTKQVLVGIGLEEPGDIAVDYLGGNIYFSDSERGTISACRADGSICTTIKTNSKHPKFVTLDARNGKMYWADWQGHGVIMSARMDGSQPDLLVDNLHNFATGLAIDSSNRRLYFVDKTIKVVMLDGKHVYSLFEEPFHHPYSTTVFENTVYWSDWTSNTIQTTDKIHGNVQKKEILLKLDTPIFGMHMYHPVLMNASSNPCSHNECSHLCLVTSNSSHVCACPNGMELYEKNRCIRLTVYRPKYLVVAGGQLFTRIQYDELGNPESHATHFDIGRVQAMAYDSFRDSLFIYDGHLKTIKYINMSDFTLGLPHPLVYEGLINVVDMDYDYATDNLYIVDAGRRLIEVISLRTQKRAHVYKFEENETPISLCVMPNYGRMMVAVVESGHNDVIHIDSVALNGHDRIHIIMNNLRGPHVRLRYVQHMDNVFLSDESNGAIDYIHPDGSARENYRELLTTVTSLAIADNYVFWTDRRTSRLFWSDIHEVTHKIRRIDLTMFPNNTQLLIQATSSRPDPKDPLLKHPCLFVNNLCSDICVQQPHRNPNEAGFIMGYTCLCPPGHVLKSGRCTAIVICSEHQIMCHKSNVCVSKEMKCDGKTDCTFGEDEEGCMAVDPTNICTADEIFCNGVCLVKRNTTMCNGEPISVDPPVKVCNMAEYHCGFSNICISRSQLCDGTVDCPQGDDELSSKCDTLSCYDTEFMCSSGSCISKTFVCDGEQDCSDGSDELACANMTCGSGFYQCRDRECVELKKRCDGQQDCFDFSDEEDCDEPDLVEVTEANPRCAVWEFTCEYNGSIICLPYTARCNIKTDCPGGSDEDGCDLRCNPRGTFACKQQMNCVSMNRVCNNHLDCGDGSDETPDACLLVNRTSHLFPAHSYGDCDEGFTCGNGQCLEWREVCNNHTDCFDKTDENGLCSTSCERNNCSYRCQPTPSGPHCVCPTGYRLGKNRSTCEDIDECQEEVCSQGCTNLPGSFLCTCHQGYAIRANRRSCKATRSNMSILYVSGNTVRSISTDGRSTVEFTDVKVPSFNDMDYNIRQSKLYVSSSEARKLIEVNSERTVITVTNVGIPTRVAVDWVTGNVYFVDATTSAMRLRVCNVKRKRCAVLQKLPSNARVTSLIIDPSSRRMFYCVTGGHESVVWYASLSGKHLSNLATVDDCNGLAVDSFKKRLYVSETGPGIIKWMNYEGDIIHTKTLADQLQAPQDLAIFEDHIYYHIANSSRLGHCILFGPKHCQTYTNRLFNANKFVIRHENILTSDLTDSCEGVVCSNICALDENGPVCICDDGMLAKDGECPELDKSKLPLFNGWSEAELTSAHHVSFSIITAVIIMVVLYLCVFVYYHFVYKPRQNRAATYSQVRFTNRQSDTIEDPCNDSVQMTTDSSAACEFENPLQYNIKGATVSMPSSPSQQNLSDTESDLDYNDKNRIIK